MCECYDKGTKKNTFCNKNTGDCSDNCKDGYEGTKCKDCKSGYYRYGDICDICIYKCDGALVDVSKKGKCNDNGHCICKSNAVGNECDKCKAGFFKEKVNENEIEQICTKCECNTDGSVGNQCGDQWKLDGTVEDHGEGKGICKCKSNTYSGDKCDGCNLKIANGKFPTCKLCGCNDEEGATTEPGCDKNLKCSCKGDFEGDNLFDNSKCYYRKGFTKIEVRVSSENPGPSKFKFRLADGKVDYNKGKDDGRLTG